MITVWGRRNSVNVQKVMWTLGELGLQYQRHDAGGSFGISEDYLQKNPNAVIPTIEDGDLVVYESNACVRHLARTYGAGSLMPNSSSSIALTDQWMDWQCSTFAPVFMQIFLHRLRLPEDKRNPDQLARSVSHIGTLLAQINTKLAACEYLVGDAFSAADIPLGTMLYRYFEMDIERPSLPCVEQYYDRLTSRPAYQQHVMIPFGRSFDEWNIEEQRNAKIQ